MVFPRMRDGGVQLALLNDGTTYIPSGSNVAGGEGMVILSITRLGQTLATEMEQDDFDRTKNKKGKGMSRSVE